MKKRYKSILSGVIVFFTVLGAVAVPSVFAEEKSESAGSGITAPPMGFNTWYTYLDGFTENTIKELVKAMEKKGLRELGYQYIQIDWGWCAEDRGYAIRDENGNMVPDPNKFSSMIALANYLHKRGFKIGYYTDLGVSGCGNGIGSYGYYQQDIEQFLKWDADLIKIDSCGGHVDYADHNEAYRAVLDCLKNADTDNSVAINICCGGGYGVTEFISGMADDYVGNRIPFMYYRTCQDISASIPKVLWEDETYGVLKSFDMAMAYPENSKPGCYFDMDTLMLENNGLTAEENKSYFTLFCIAPSTLMLAVDIPNISDETLAIISNEEAIAVNQDPLCHSARLVREDVSGLQVYNKVQSDENGHRVRAVMLFNRTSDTAEISVNWSDIGLEGDCLVRDLWEHEDKGIYDGEYSASVPSHGVVLLKVTEQAGDIRNYETTAGSSEIISASSGEATTEIPKPSEQKSRLFIYITAAVAAIIVVVVLLLFIKRKHK